MPPLLTPSLGILSFFLRLRLEWLDFSFELRGDGFGFGFDFEGSRILGSRLGTGAISRLSLLVTLEGALF